MTKADRAHLLSAASHCAAAAAHLLQAPLTSDDESVTELTNLSRRFAAAAEELKVVQ